MEHGGVGSDKCEAGRLGVRAEAEDPHVELEGPDVDFPRGRRVLPRVGRKGWTSSEAGVRIAI